MNSKHLYRSFARGARNACAPAPCITYRPDATGALVAVASETREPIWTSDYEPERIARRLRVMCTQETGEEYLIGFAVSGREANVMIARHLATHPEHRSAWTERA